MTTQTDLKPDIEDTENPTFVRPHVRSTNKADSLVTVTSRDHEWLIDEPKFKGGTDLGPTPLESLLGSLVGCETVVLGLVAKAIGFKFSDLNIDCQGKADMRGARGVRGVRPYFTEVTMTIEIATDETSDRLALLRRNVELRCPVMNLFGAADVEMNVKWTTIPAA